MSASENEPLNPRPTPTVPGLFWLGNTLEMAKDPAAFFLRCYRQYGPVFQITILGQRYKVLGGAEAANFMGTREGKDCLRSKEFWEGLRVEFKATSTLVGSDGETHKKLRDILRQGYSRESLKGRYNELVQITDGSIERDWLVGRKVPVIEAFQYMVTDQLGTIITGSAPREYMKDIRITILYILSCLVTRQRPKFLLWNPAYRRGKRRMLELSRKMRAEYYANKDDPNRRRTFVDELMEAHHKSPDVMPASNLDLQLVAPYVAGLDTVANTLAACVYCVLKYPEVKARVLAEVDALFAEGEISEDGLLHRLPALNGAVMESMRLYPIAVAQMRAANKDFVFEGHSIKEGEMLYVATCVPHFQDEFFPNAMTFDIDRYQKSRAEHQKAGAYSPYGRGPHTCLGKSLAEIQLVLSMARLLHRLDLELESPDYVLKTKTAPTPGPAMSFKVRVKGLRH